MTASPLRDEDSRFVFLKAAFEFLAGSSEAADDRLAWLADVNYLQELFDEGLAGGPP